MSFMLSAGGAVAKVDAQVESAQSPDWSPVGWFLLAGAALGLAAMGAAWMLLGRPGPRPNWNDPVTWLDASFSFDDSWATTAGTAATLLTGFFASTDILSALGVDPGNQVAVMLVAGAIASALAGAGVLITKTFTDGEDPVVWALLVAGLATMTGLFAQIGVVAVEAHDLDLGWLSTWGVYVIAVGAALLALAYAILAMKRTLTAPPPAPDVPDDELLDAAVTALTTGAPPADDAVFSARVVELARSIQQASSVSTDQLTTLLSAATDKETGVTDSEKLRAGLRKAPPAPRRRRKRSAAL
jgi:hypothetical protein